MDDEVGCTVIVTVDAPPEVMPDMRAHAELGIDRFPGFDGFVRGELRVSEDGTRLVQHLEWTSHEAYVRCRDDPRWHELPSTTAFMDHVSAGRARVDAREYRRVAMADGRRPEGGARW